MKNRSASGSKELLGFFGELILYRYSLSTVLNRFKGAAKLSLSGGRGKRRRQQAATFTYFVAETRGFLMLHIRIRLYVV